MVTVELDLLFVEPAALGRGHGQRLFAHACEAARTAGAVRLLVESDPNATGFYERMGMVRTGERTSPVEAGRVMPVLALDLT
jgi:GNAT superfamily N-acetyltransferase